MNSGKIGPGRRDVMTGALGLATLAALGSAPARASTRQVKITRFPTGAGSTPIGFAIAPDDTVWFTTISTGTIGRIKAGEVRQFPLEKPASPHRLALGHDGNMWFSNFSGNRVGRVTPDGQVTQFEVKSKPNYSLDGVAGQAGSYGKEWFNPKTIPIPTNAPFGICAGPQGAIWFTEFLSNRIARITTKGEITDWDVPWDPLESTCRHASLSIL